MNANENRVKNQQFLIYNLTLEKQKYNSENNSKSTQTFSCLPSDICRYGENQEIESTIVLHLRKKKEIFNNNYLRLIIIGKYTPKLLGKKTCILSLSLEVIHLILSLKCEHSPQLPETKGKKNKRERNLFKIQTAKKLSCQTLDHSLLKITSRDKYNS